MEAALSPGQKGSVSPEPTSTKPYVLDTQGLQTDTEFAVKLFE
jgi:hypothetical protein